MKKALKILFYTIFSFATLLFLFSYVYTQSVKSNMKKFEHDVNSKWAEYFVNSTEKVKSTKEFINNPEFVIPNRNDINQIIERNLRERTKYSNECKLDFVELEYELNKTMMSLLDSTNINSDQYKTFKNIFITSNNRLNGLIEEYNNIVLFYHKYIIAFPRFLVAKQYGFKPKKFFDIKYGVINEDPIERNKKIQDWVAGKDTTLQSK